jgi:restriction system protein
MECGAKRVRTLGQRTLKSECEAVVSNGAPRNTETVYLQTLDGFEFEDFCGHVFEKLGYGRVQVMPYTGDKGRDLIIHTSQETKIVVECKHHPHGIIGRPVVQKLHSAVITEGAAKGMLVTTGKFSEEAINHVREIHPTIELIDMNLLRDLAERAGIHIARSGEQPPLSYLPISNGNRVAMNVISSFAKRIVSQPQASSHLLNLQESRLRLCPVYQVRYNIDHDFETSVGVIHAIHVNNQELLLDGTTGQPLVTGISSFLRGTPTLNTIEAGESLRVVERGSFCIDQTTLASKAKQAIASLHSKVVSYYGRNNVHYETVCTPGALSSVMLSRSSSLSGRYVYVHCRKDMRLLWSRNLKMCSC